jgi:hypothetical protein
MSANYTIPLMIAACCVLSAQAPVDRDSNPKASYPSGAPVQRTVSRTLEYTYTQRDFVPPYRMSAGGRTASRFDTPDQTMIVRSDAMVASDYDGWLSTWDDDAKARFALEYASPARLDEQKRQWHGILAVGRMALFKQIETRSFVILTYRVLDQQGRDIGHLELPSVFRKIGARWFGTQELSTDPLLGESPWMTGQDTLRREIR